MQIYHIEWKSIQANLVIILLLLIHSQTLHENNIGMRRNQKEVISISVSLVIIPFHHHHSSIPMKHT